MEPKLTHICLHVASIERCAKFYREYARMRIIDDQSGVGQGNIFMTCNDSPGGPILQLMGGGPVTRSIDNIRHGDSHMGFDVGSVDEVVDIAQRARQEGILLWEPDSWIPGAWFCGLLDPNGNCIEFSHNHPLPKNTG